MSPAEAEVRRANLAATVLLLVGLLQLAGAVTGLRPLRGIGLATAASPLPKVFSDVNGFETFASDFWIEYELAGRSCSQAITPELYSRLDGSYNRRNVYGAALSYGPRLPEAIWESVFCKALEPGGAFRAELGIPEDASGVRVRIKTKTRDRTDEWTLEPDCHG